MAGSDTRSVDRTHYYSPDRLALAYAERQRLLRLMADWDAKKKAVREPQHYDEPVGKWEAEERKCSKCSLTTRHRTPRGRPVHPACEGWIDTLSDAGQVAVLYAVSTVLTVSSVEVIDQ